MEYKYILVEEKNNCVGVITLNRPKEWNALSSSLIIEVSNAIKKFEEDKKIGAIVLTGGNKVFAAGADIKELVTLDFASAYNNEFITKEWKGLENHSKPIIAAVCGVALGGGCELSLLCDIVICDETAKFGQPEVKIGTMPGIGGTQRLTRAVGKSKAMLMCLTGEMIDAQEARDYGLVAKISEEGNVIDDAIQIATNIALMSQPIVKLIKESIDNSYESSLQVGLKSERKSFYSTFSLEDKNEGMNAFIEKRKAIFKNK
ncbi:enoyl-CoA hydratase-related protein [Poseidonibacter antarcticus]|uniref:enoyl-CoA hydratase-related protein n=1 Tax=Poseidonibacter antarcticus TaxID=2478538 RepID=UPI000EF4695C|nr:enoyl-CoA hydratase-related protein [Poseidonibacter antarcticus]